MAAKPHCRKYHDPARRRRPGTRANGVKQHLVRLQWIGAEQKGPAVRQLDMGHLQLGAFTAQNGKVLAPVKLEGLAGIKMQRHKGPAPRRLLFALAICFPPSRKGRHPGIRAGEAKHHEIGMQLLYGPPFLARLASLGLQPVRRASRQRDQACFAAPASRILARWCSPPDAWSRYSATHLSAAQSRGSTASAANASVG